MENDVTNGIILLIKTHILKNYGVNVKQITIRSELTDKVAITITVSWVDSLSPLLISIVMGVM